MPTATQPSLHVANKNTVTGLTPPPADGLACSLCETTYLDNPAPRHVVSRSTSNSRIFTCMHCLPHTLATAIEGAGR